MDNRGIEDISDAIGRLDFKKLASETDRYLKVISMTDELIRRQKPLADKDQKLAALCNESVEKESAILMSEASRALNLMLNFRFTANGHVREFQKTFSYFKKLKSYHIELLMSICDETEMIQTMLRQSAKTRLMIQTHSETLQKYDYLTKVLRERMTDRPTTLLKLRGSGKKITALNQTFDEMNEYESRHAADLQQQADQHVAGAEFETYYDIIRELHGDIRHRQRHIAADVAELKQGWKLFKSIVIQGYSSRMEGLLNSLLVKHGARQAAFRDHVLKCRQMLIFNN
jgi:hypothetical protein